MPDISKKDVQGALDQMDAASDQFSNDNLLTPEQLQTINDIVGESDAELKASKITEYVDSLLQQAREGEAKIAQLLKENGFDPSDLSRFMSNDRLDADSQRELRDAVGAFEQSFRREVDAEASRIVPQRAATPKAGRIKV